MLEGTAGRDAELKQQGVIEAAQDPSTSIDGRQAEEALLQQSKASGAAAFSFDPNASPEEKARIVKERSEEMGRPHRKHVNAALVSDVDDEKTAGYDLPPPSKEGALELGATDEKSGLTAKEEEYEKVG